MPCHTNAKYHVFTDFNDPAVGGIFVPQAEYNRTSPPYPYFPTITFSQGDQRGVNLQAALGGRNSGIADGDSRPTTTATSTKIKIRILWPGYMEYNMDINVKEHSRGAEAIPKWKIAMCVANAVRSFYENSKPTNSQDRGIGSWNLRYIPFERLRLLELRHVSTGSWQPVLVYERP